MIVSGALIGGMLDAPMAGASPPSAEKKDETPKRFPVENAEEAEKLSAKLIEEYLGNNVSRALLLKEMRPTIEEFRALAPNFVLRKCMDGRLQGPNAKGCPETIIYFGRTHGAVDGQVIMFFVVTVAAAEAAVGLALVIALFRHRETLNPDAFTSLKW